MFVSGKLSQVPQAHRPGDVLSALWGGIAAHSPGTGTLVWERCHGDSATGSGTAPLSLNSSAPSPIVSARSGCELSPIQSQGASCCGYHGDDPAGGLLMAVLLTDPHIHISSSHLPSSSASLYSPRTWFSRLGLCAYDWKVNRSNPRVGRAISPLGPWARTVAPDCPKNTTSAE